MEIAPSHQWLQGRASVACGDTQSREAWAARGHMEMHGGADGAAGSSPVWHSHPQKDPANSTPPHPPLTSTHLSAHKEQGLLPAFKAPGLSGMAGTD